MALELLQTGLRVSATAFEYSSNDFTAKYEKRTRDALQRVW